MIVTANFCSVKTSYGISIFRTDTSIHSHDEPGEAIGLVYMFNPGSSRPVSDDIFNKLQTTEFSTEKPVIATFDNTLKRVKNLVTMAYEEKMGLLPDKWTILIENLFNLREPDSKKAKKLLDNITGLDQLMYQCRTENNYPIVWIAWGKTNVKKDQQRLIIKKNPNAIKVHRKKINGEIREVEYPAHPLYVKTEYFLEAALKSSEGREIYERY